MKSSGKTDWKRLSEMQDSEIDYSDIPVTGDDFWKDAAITYNVKKVTVKLKIDEDLAQWLKEMGSGSDAAINNLLRSYFIGAKCLSGK